MNTLLVTVDSLRYDHYQYMDQTKAYLGDTHDRAFSTATATLGTFPTVFTGRYNEPHDISPSDSFVNQIEDQTVGITANQLISERYGYDGGFDHFKSPISRGEVTLKDKVAERIPRGRPYQFASRAWSSIERLMAVFSEPANPFRDGSDMIDEFLDVREDESFGWLHFMEPHHPYSPTKEDGTRARRMSRQAISSEDPGHPDEVRDFYKQEVEDLDEKLGELWDSIPADTRVIFTADHGELLGEYGRWGHPGFLVPELLRVPFATRNVDVQSPVVSLVDLAAYVLESEFRDATRDRDVAYASIKDDKCAIDSNHVLNTDEALPIEEEKDVDPALRRKLNQFRSSGVSKSDAVEEDLEALGYLE